MKIKDLLIEVVNPKIGNDKFTEALQSDNFLETELDDDTVNGIKQGFGSLLTMEAAKNNSGLIDEVKNTYKSQLQKSIFTKMDPDLQKIAENNGVTFSEGADIQQKLEVLKNAEPKANGDVKGITKKYNDLQEEFRKYKETSAQALQTQQSEHEAQRLKDKQISFLSTNYQLSDSYTEMADLIHERVLGNVSAKANISIGDNGFEIRQKDNPELKVFDSNNKEMTYKDLVDSEMSKYLKKSNSNGDNVTKRQLPPMHVQKQTTILQDRSNFR